MKEHGQVYIVRNRVNSKGYVGQTTATLARRWKQHQDPKSGCWLLARAIKKYGAESFDITHLEFAESAEDLNAKERAWIDKLETLSPAGYNIFKGGEQPPGIRLRKSVGRKRYLAARALEGHAKGPSPLKEDDVRGMFRMYDDGSSVSDIAKTYDVDTSTVSHILRGSTWSHLGLRPNRPLTNRHTTREDAEAVFSMNFTGQTNDEITHRLGLSRSTVCHVLHGRVFPDIRERLGPPRSRYLPDAVKQRILELRKAGWSFPKIGRDVGVTATTAWNVCREVLPPRPLAEVVRDTSWQEAHADGLRKRSLKNDSLDPAGAARRARARAYYKTKKARTRTTTRSV